MRPDNLGAPFLSCPVRLCIFSCNSLNSLFQHIQLSHPRGSVSLEWTNSVGGKFCSHCRFPFKGLQGHHCKAMGPKNLNHGEKIRDINSVPFSQLSRTSKDRFLNKTNC